MRRLGYLVLISISLSACQSMSFFKKDDAADALPKQSEQGYYDQATEDLNKERYDRAVKALTDLRAYYPVGKYSQQALLDLMYTHFQQGEYADAASDADRFIRLYPTHSQADYAHYVRGVANMSSGFGGIFKFTSLNAAHRDIGYLRLAFANFQTFLQKYPNSPYAPDAAKRMQFIYNQFSEAEMHAARFYVKRKAYVAAVVRAHWVFQYYPLSQQTPEAIATLAYSYQQLGMDDLANQYKTLLKINYPHLLTSDNQVKLTNARRDASWLNKLSLGVLGQRAEASDTNQSIESNVTTKPQTIRYANVSQAMNLQLPDDGLEPATNKKPTLAGNNMGLRFGLANKDNQTPPPAKDNETNSNSSQTQPVPMINQPQVNQP